MHPEHCATGTTFINPYRLLSLYRFADKLLHLLGEYTQSRLFFSRQRILFPGFLCFGLIDRHIYIEFLAAVLVFFHQYKVLLHKTGNLCIDTRFISRAEFVNLLFRSRRRLGRHQPFHLAYNLCFGSGSITGNAVHYGILSAYFYILADGNTYQLDAVFRIFLQIRAVLGNISVYPAQTISETAKETIAEYTRRLAKALHVVGMINIQFIVCGEEVYVIEVNPRSSRTVPYISKVTGIPIVPLATKVILGYKLKDLGYEPGLQPEAKHFAIKMPVFSFEKIRGADISLGPEMKSTGECLGIAETFNEALYKAFIGAGIKLPKHRNMIITVKEEDHEEVVPIAKRFEALGYRIYATRGTAKVLKENGIKAIRTNKLEQPAPNLMDLILGHKIDVVIDTPPQGVEHQKDGFVIRRNAIETGVNVLTSLDTAEALVTSLENTDLNNLTLIDIATIADR